MEEKKEKAVTIQKISEVLNMSVNEVEGLCEKCKIPFHITDEGTAWEAKRFFVKDVLKAVDPVEEEPEKEEADNDEPVSEEAEKEEAAKKAKARTEDPL